MVTGGRLELHVLLEFLSSAEKEANILQQTGWLSPQRINK